MPRLDPSTTTVTKLVLAAAAKCGFPDCKQQLIVDDQLIADICHIQAASPGGERYNPSQTDQERRAYDNLIILCRNHHRVTDNTDIYTVEKLKGMKLAHEALMEAEPTLDLQELDRVVNNMTSGGFSYTFTNHLQPYKEYEYQSDVSSAENKLRNELSNVQRVAGHSSAADYAQQIFGQQLELAKRPFTARKANSEKMFQLELQKIDDYYNELKEAELSKIRGRGMGESGQVIVLNNKVKKYKDMAIRELNVLFGKD